MYLDGIILKCSSHIQDTRTSSAIYHLLKGNKGIQTVHDARIFHLERYYGIYQSLDKRVFEDAINNLYSNGLLSFTSQEENLYRPTSMAAEWMERHQEKIPFHYYNGLKYAAITDIFFERLLLLTQTFINSKMRHFSFIPIVDKSSITAWVKAFYKKMITYGEDRILSHLYSDLSGVLNNFKNDEAEFFVDHLTGYKQYGMSSDQLAVKHGLSKHDVKLLLTGMIHQLLSIIEKQKKDFKIISSLMDDILTNSFITNTAAITYNFLKDGYTIDQISRIRRLKENTINDHIVEISLFDPDFSINNYVNMEKQEEIVRAVTEIESYKLKDIKRAVSDNISYFQIRLVLAAINIPQKIGEYHGR